MLLMRPTTRVVGLPVWRSAGMTLDHDSREQNFVTEVWPNGNFSPVPPRNRLPVFLLKRDFLRPFTVEFTCISAENSAILVSLDHVDCSAQNLLTRQNLHTGSHIRFAFAGLSPRSPLKLGAERLDGRVTIFGFAGLLAVGVFPLSEWISPAPPRVT